VPKLALSVGRVAGPALPAFFDLLMVSIRIGLNLGLRDVVGKERLGVELVEACKAGAGFPGTFLLLLKLVSTGIGVKRFLPAGAPSAAAPPELVLSFCIFSFLLLRVLVSTGSGAKRRTFFTVSSTGPPVGGVEFPDIVDVGIGGIEAEERSLPTQFQFSLLIQSIRQSKGGGAMEVRVLELLTGD
jgi:hypothetical protein